MLVFVLLIWIWPVTSFSSEKTIQPADITATGWTDSDWANWWEKIESLYLDGIEDEGLYWLLRHDLTVLGYYEPILQQVEIPPPYSGWSNPDPGGPFIPYSTNSTVAEDEYFVPMYGQMPSEWADLILAHGLNPADFGGAGPIPAPPGWVAASILWLGGNLSMVPHPGTRAVGVVMTNIGGVMVIWIELEDDDVGDDEDN